MAEEIKKSFESVIQALEDHAKRLRKLEIQNIPKVNKTGWIQDPDPWTYVSPTSFSKEGNWSSYFTIGVRVSIRQGTSTRFMVVLNSSYNAGTDTTTVNLIPNGNFGLTNVPIDNAYYTYALHSQQGSGYYWHDYTPDLYNITLGNGTINYCRFNIMQRIVNVVFLLTFGSTTTTSGAIMIGYPMSTGENFGSYMMNGIATFRDTSAGISYMGFTYGSGSFARAVVMTPLGSYIRIADASPTIPFTWATGDRIGLQYSFRY